MSADSSRLSSRRIVGPSRRLFLAAWSAFATVSAPSAEEGGPVAIVTGIYRRAAAGQGDSGGTFLTGSSRARRAAFSKRTADLWDRVERRTRKGEMGPIEFDLVTNSQDPSVKGFTVTAEAMDADTATVAARMQSEYPRSKPADEVVRYLFVREGGRWLIDYMRGTADGQTWSLREMLSGA